MPEAHVSPHIEIPTRDGTLLSAAVHWPPGAPDDGQRYPAIIEYHPYRKDDRSSARSAEHQYFAQHGIVSVQLDVRGTGSSQGTNTDEYMAAETLDGYDAVEWLAAQPWCTGNVGMFGSSYGGFTSFQVAMAAPPHLKAIIPIYATDDRYTDDCHYKGGALKAYYDTGTYGTGMIAWNAMPPDPGLVGDDWEDMWQLRLESNTPYMLNWLGHQTDGPYWRPGSLRGQYEKVKAATFIIGGWQDGYPHPTVRAFANLTCPKKLLVGPWNHARPDVAIPGPNIHYLHEMRRWFDLWLKGDDDGVSNEPPVSFFVQSYDPPDPRRRNTTGVWRHERDWPAEGVSTQVFFPDVSRRGLEAEPGDAASAEFKVDPTTGITGGLWSGGLPFGLPDDQRRDEGLSLNFTSAPFENPLTIAGSAVVHLLASSSAEVALFVVKISDVAPDGMSALVTRGVLNGTRRDSMTDPAALVPGEAHDLAIELDATCWRFEPGHRLRLSISGSDFPNSWPTPLPATLTVHTGEQRPDEGERRSGDAPTRLELPVIPNESQVNGPSFLPAPEKTQQPTGEPPTWEVTEKPLEQTVTLKIRRAAGGEGRDGVRFSSTEELRLTASRRDPSEVTAVGVSTVRTTRTGLDVESKATQEIRSDATHFHWSVQLVVTLNGEQRHTRTWEQDFPRELL